MDHSSTKYRQLTLLLIVICLALGGLVMHLLSEQADSQSMAMKKAVSTEVPAQPSVPVVADGADSKEKYTEFVKRPLFMQDRRPPRALAKNAGKTKSPTDVAVMKPGWELIGTLITAETRHAMFWNPVGQVVIRVKQGGSIEGWKVSEVRNKQVEISRDGETHSYSLPEFNQSD